MKIKKISASVISAVMLISAAGMNYTATFAASLLGDVTADGNIDAIDASKVLMAYANTATGKPSGFDAEQTKLADINSDGNVDAIDASMILSFYAYSATGGASDIYEFYNISNTENSNENQGFSLADIPTYCGNPYVVVNNNIPYFEEFTTEVFEEYSELDSLGRCGAAFANVCVEIMPTEPRGEIGMIKPTGWHTVRYDDLISDKYLYNRCHLIGFQLAGENANPKNLITGTRYLNITGMLPFENMVDDYVEKTNNHVMYRVTPVFEGDNLVADGVLMEAYSVEDNGEGVQFNVFCYNVQPYIGIDYATGESWILGEETSPTEPATEATAYDFVINKNSNVFHKPTCSSLAKMSESNKEFFSGTSEELIQSGYKACGTCKP